MPTLAALYRYPVKGLSAEALARTELAAGGTVPFDRAYAIENGPSGFDRETPRTLPKTQFLMLMRQERLAELNSLFDDATHTLTIRHNGAVVAAARLDTAEGRRAIEAYFDGFAARELRGPAKVLEAPGFSFSDSPQKVVSLINLETVRALEREVGVPIHPLRFRANLYIEGAPAWAEFDWIGREIGVGGARLTGTKRITRCAATNVNPDTAARDLTIPASLLKGHGHADCGIYLSVTGKGAVAVGDPVTVPLG